MALNDQLRFVSSNISSLSWSFKAIFYINNLEHLLPEELEIIKEMIEDLLPKMVSEKLTNQKYQMTIKEIRCVYCNSE